VSIRATKVILPLAVALIATEVILPLFSIKNNEEKSDTSGI